jgi:hypothetical protein
MLLELRNFDVVYDGIIQVLRSVNLDYGPARSRLCSAAMAQAKRRR